MAPPVISTSALVGRDAELATARRLLDASRIGEGGLLVVTGEAGIGKSRLLAEVAALGRSSGCTVLIGRAVPGGGTYRAVAGAVAGHLRDTQLDESAELRPFRAALGRLVPGWAGSSTGTESGRGIGAGGDGGPDPVVVLGEGLLRLLVATSRSAGCLLLLEDLHWADADTVALVAYLAGAARSSPVLLVVSVRDDQPVPRPGGAVADDLAGLAGVTTLRLGRLDDHAVALLAAACMGGDPVPADVLEVLLAKAEGLPVLVEELLAGLLEPDRGSAPVPVPPTLAGLVARRMASLDESARQVLQAAAVFGTEPDWTLLAVVSGQDEPVVLRALRSATSAGLLVAHGARLRWRHALTRDAVLATLLPPEQAVLARRAAAEVSARGGPHDDALAAELLALAGDPAGSAAVLLGLARRDMDRGALRSATDLIARAAATGALPTRVAIDQVHLLTLLGRGSEALDTGPAALLDVTGDEHAELCLQLARAAVSCSRWEEARRYVERAGRPADPRSAVLSAEAAYGAGDPERAAALARTGAELAEQAGRPEALCAALVIDGRCASRGDLPHAAAAFGRAAQCAAEHGLAPWRIEALCGMGLLELHEQDVPVLLAEARELALDAGLLGVALSIEVILAERVLTTNGPHAAKPMARRIAEEAGRLGLSGLQALGEVSFAAGRAAAGDLAGMDALLGAATTRAHASVEVTALAAAARALPHLLAHDLRRADALLDRGMSVLREHASAAPLAYWGLWALLRMVAGCDGQPAEFLRTAPVKVAISNRAALSYADAVAAGRSGRGDLAVDLLHTGDEILAGQHWWRRLLRLLVLEAAVADGWGDPVPALRADLTAFERDGEHLLARTCRDLLRQAGAPTRRGRGSTPVPPALRALGITSREMDVLGLVTDGLSNAEIGRRLFVSPRTVETHVANLLAKTGATDRAGLRAVMQRTP
ncbi:MAG: AAA family ATPase [Actinomycetota bacterium]|nr:AAA family ATPase [Actinomycetota bacterium]